MSKIKTELIFSFMRSAIILFLLLLAIASIRIFTGKDYKEGQVVAANHTFLDNPTSRFGQQIFKIRNVVVFAKSDTEFSYGDKIFLEGKVIFSSQKNGNEQYLIIKDPKIKNLPKSFFLSLVGFLRNKVELIFARNLPRDESALLIGIVFGIRENISGEFKNALSGTGVLHVVAASGANVSIVASFLLGVFSYFLNRKLALFITALGILFYALFSGFSPSIVRASLMALALFTAGGIGRQNYSLLTLFFVGLVMVIFEPLNISDIGFQLSFVSTLGILTIKPAIEKMLGLKNPLFEDLLTTISAQLAALPILLGSFSSYSAISVLVNLFVLWTIPLLMVIGMVSVILGLVSPVLSLPALYLSYPLLVYFKKVVFFFSQSPLSLRLENVPIFMILGYYLIITSIVLLINKLKTKK